MEIIKELSHELKLGYVIRNYQEEIIEVLITKLFDTSIVELDDSRHKQRRPILQIS